MLYLIIFLFLLGFAIIFSCYFIAGTIIHLNRQPIPKNPKDYDLDYKNIILKPSDGINIKGWLIPGSSQKIIIMTHVGGLTKYGSYSRYKNISKLYNKEVEFLKTAHHLHNKGYNVLMFDFRNPYIK